MLLKQEQIQYINSITHAGKVVLFGTDTQGKVWYTIKQDGFEDSYLNTPPEQRNGWENWQVLEFPNEAKDDASVVAKETNELTYQENNSQFILRSRYRTQDQTAVAPVQLVSGTEHLYVFRQSKQNTLLCDRYVLDGIANKLVRKLQVRFKRSGQRFAASEKMQQGIGGLKNIDSVDYRDANGIPFYEPTTELSFINNLQKGWFSVVQLPTVELDQYRWHIFAYNSQTQKVELSCLRVSDEGLFDVQDYTIFEPKSEDDPTLISRNIAGIIKRTLDLNVQVGNGITATKYYVQTSQQTEAGTQLMRDATKVMLGIVTTQGNVATISFAALNDGTLSQISDTAATQTLRSNVRDVLLPLNTLDEIKSFGIASPPPEGKITAFNRVIEDGIATVQVTSAETAIIKNNQQIFIQNTSGYDGHYTITKIDNTTFEINAPWVEISSSSNSQLGTWQAVPPKEQAVVFDGIITGYELIANGKLRVKAENHGLENGDEVQIFDTTNYDGTYAITKIDNQNFAVNNLTWQNGEAVNLKLQSLKRRGIVLNGVDSYVELPPESMPIGNEITITFWAKGGISLPKNNAFIYANGVNNERVLNIHLPWSNGSIYFDCGADGNGSDRIEKATQPTEYKGEWVHWAFTKNAKIGEMKIYRNGILWHSVTGCNRPLPKTAILHLGKFATANSDYYEGTVSELCIWKVARSGKEINNSMYLQLTGQETNLVGYWRLGGIAIDENKQRQVVDFSVNKNDGIVYGDCYVSAVTLNRKLADGKTDVAQYLNKELFAVTQRATYEETFEFKANIKLEPNNINGSKIFQCTYWGQKSHRSDKKITFAGEITQIQLASEPGWYQASCRFTVPDEVNLVRCLEISEVKGTWTTLEVRKHRIQKTSDVINQASYTDTVTLSTLGSPQLTTQLEQLQGKELEEQTLVLAKSETEKLLDFVKRSDTERQAQITAKETAVAQQQIKVDDALRVKTDYENKLKLTITIYTLENYQGDSLVLGRGSHTLTNFRYSGSLTWNDRMRSARIPEGLIVGFYEHTFSGRSNTGNTGSWPSLGSVLNNQITSITVEAYGWDASGVENVLLPQARTLWETENNLLTILKKELESLKSQNSNLNQKDLEDTLSAIIKRLDTVRTELNTLNTNVINGFKTTQQTAYTMPAIATKGELATTGAILDFMRSASRVTALETVEGMVQLSYFDQQGTLRQGVFDAAADEVNTYFEQWLPDQYPTCLNCDSGAKRITLGASGNFLGDNWTIEANFVYPFPDTAQWNTLIAKTGGDRPVAVQGKKYLGTYVNNTFYYCLVNSTLANNQTNAYDLSLLPQGWHNLAVVGTTETQGANTSSKTIFYIDGKKVGECLAKTNSNIQQIGNTEAGGEAFGKISEIRFWNLPLTDTEIQANSQVYLTGNEPGLAAYYRLSEGSGTQARDYTGKGNNGTIVSENWFGNTKVLASPISQVMNFSGNGSYINIPSTVLNNRSAFTLEGWIKPASFVGTTSLFGQNDLIEFGFQAQQLAIWTNNSGLVQTAYSYPVNEWHHVAVVGDGQKVYLYIDGVKKAEGGATTSNYGTSAFPVAIAAGVWNGGDKDPFTGQIADVRVWNIGRTQAEIQANMTKRLTGKETGLELYLPLNSTYTEGSTTKVFELVKNSSGTVYNASLITATPKVVKNSVSTLVPVPASVFDGVDDYINLANPATLAFPGTAAYTIEAWINVDTAASEMTIISKWNGGVNGSYRFFLDSQKKLGINHNVAPWAIVSSGIVPTGKFNHIAATYNGSIVSFYINGQPAGTGTLGGSTDNATNVLIGAYHNQYNPSASFFKGKMGEVRIWNKARTQAEIQADMNQRLVGTEANLVGYWRLDSMTGTTVTGLVGSFNGTVNGGATLATTNDLSFPGMMSVLSLDCFPLNQGKGSLVLDSAITSVEYGTYDVDPVSKQKSAMMRRMFAYPTGKGIEVLADKRIESLELLWIGNAQFKPTLLGYMEGAPPVPSENMNQDGDYQYNGATSVELTTTEDVEYSWNRSQDAGLGGSADIFLGTDSQTLAGVGVATQIESTKAGFKGTLDMSYQWLNQSNITSSSSLAMTDRLELRGAPEVNAQFSQYGRRFIPKNIGYALVVSSLADVFVTRLSRTKKMVGYEVRPVEDIPPDVNTITFLMNPAYVMNGTLDGLVGSSAANDQFYGHVPQMRAQYGSLYPASYFRLMEAYNLKQQIEKADKERQSYFDNFNSNLVDETALNRQANQATPLQAISLNEGAETINTSGQGTTDAQKQAQIDQIQEEGGAKLKDLQKQGDQRKQEISSRIKDIKQRTHALASFAGWQKNMENILVRSGKRNIVNTYVWDADGGLRVEEQSFANTSEHTIGGSFGLSAGMGYEGDISVFKVSGALTALATTNMTQTMTKTQASSKGMELKVDLGGIEALGITDENDVPFQPGEKVDRFRMMSFYLENSTNNYLDFFRYVVDPEWLASNDEEARALRQVQCGRPNKTWRVLHRVTYVERPSLMGFGVDIRSLDSVTSTQARTAWLFPANTTILDEVKLVHERVDYLERENAKLQAKLDTILDWINKH
ncbi:hypothetical protein FD724_40135, partial (plasmid) [Nostoc sp. C057]|uniref:LamG-like jellyroll fold domain-containing protein n=1 Tax=Nostoc sp. C057 TaxID=2576903 RepID=UPI0015C35E93